MALFYSLTQATTLTYALTCFYSFESTKPEEKGPRLKGLKVPADFKITIDDVPPRQFTIYDVSPQQFTIYVVSPQRSNAVCRITPYTAWEELPYREKGGDGKSAINTARGKMDQLTKLKLTKNQP